MLIVDSVADGLIDPTEWAEAVKEVKKAQVHQAFQEMFLYDLVAFHSVTLYRYEKLGKG